MSINRDWNDAYVELRHRAEDVRGYIELDPDTANSVRWPRTIGADVIAIAALVDPHVRRIRNEALRHRWRLALVNIERHAIAAPGKTYAENRIFWDTLVRAFVFLSSMEAPLPDPALWNALLEQLGDVLAFRNAGPKGDGPFKAFDAKTFSDLFLAQLELLRAERGSDQVVALPGETGGTKTIPRTTNGDVVQLADYWSKQLASVKKVMGHDGVVKKWTAALVGVDVARKADPNAIYPTNNTFWRALQTTAVQVSVADEQPSEWDLALDALGDGVKYLPENLREGAKALASGVSDVAGGIAKGVGSIAGSAGKGLFAGFGTPLLIGGGLLGLFLISRARNKGDKKEA
jgi:hypothetical protein